MLTREERQELVRLYRKTLVAQRDPNMFMSEADGIALQAVHDAGMRTAANLLSKMAEQMRGDGRESARAVALVCAEAITAKIKG